MAKAITGDQRRRLSSIYMDECVHDFGFNPDNNVMQALVSCFEDNSEKKDLGVLLAQVILDSHTFSADPAKEQQFIAFWRDKAKEITG
jgi:hypothetical protein